MLLELSAFRSEIQTQIKLCKLIWWRRWPLQKSRTLFILISPQCASYYLVFSFSVKCKLIFRLASRDLVNSEPLMSCLQTEKHHIEMKKWGEKNEADTKWATQMTPFSIWYYIIVWWTLISSSRSIIVLQFFFL